MKKNYAHKITKNMAVISAAIIFMGLMAAFPDITGSGFKTAFMLWLNSVVPVLLPFFIFADFVKKAGNNINIPMRVYPFAMAVLSGYPMGAKATGDLLASGKVDRTEGKSILSFSFVTGPAFILGTAGGLLGSKQAAVIILAAHYIGAFENGLLWRMRRTGSGSKSGGSNIKVKGINDNNSLFECFSSAIAAGFKAMMMILAFLVFFMIGIDFIEHMGLFSIIGGQQTAAFVKGIMEMTVGINAVSMCSTGIALKTVLTSFMVSFGGMSVLCQASSMMSGSGLRLRDIAEVKFTHGLLSGTAAAVLACIVY